jgi:hypothetical protein
MSGLVLAGKMTLSCLLAQCFSVAKVAAVLVVVVVVTMIVVLEAFWKR